MGTVEKPKTPPAVAGSVSKTAAPRAPTVEEGISDAARSMARRLVLDRNPYVKMAFTNPYNLSLFAGAMVAAGLTLNPVLAIVALGLEALWLLHAPDSKRLRHLLWDPRFDKLRKAIEAQERAQRLATVGEAERKRVDGIVARQEQMPDRATRREAAKLVDPDLSDRDADRYGDGASGDHSCKGDSRERTH